jgi:hypothetical protein
MFTAILAFLTGLGPVVQAITGKITDLKMAKIKAESDIDKATIQAQIEEAHDKRAVLVAQAGHRIGALFLSLMQLAFVIPAAVYINKILIWDKVIGAFDGCAGVVKVLPSKAGYVKYQACQAMYTTDPIDQNMWWIILAIVSFLFVTTIKNRFTRNV